MSASPRLSIARRVDSSGIALKTRRFTLDRKSTRLNSSHSQISYAVFCLKKKKRLKEVREGITYPDHEPLFTFLLRHTSDTGVTCTEVHITASRLTRIEAFRAALLLMGS